MAILLLGSTVQARLSEHYYSQFTTYTRGELSNGSYALS